MIKQTIICDRCGREVSANDGLTKSGCVTIRIDAPCGESQYSRHLCPDCKTAFHRFMDNLYVVSPLEDLSPSCSDGNGKSYP